MKQLEPQTSEMVRSIKDRDIRKDIIHQRHEWMEEQRDKDFKQMLNQKKRTDYHKEKVKKQEVENDTEKGTHRERNT